MKSRLLGMAFASADVLLELDGDHRVAFAVGAGPSPGVDPGVAWPGRTLQDILDPASCTRLKTAFAALGAGVRSDAIEVSALMPDGLSRPGLLRAFALPELTPAVSCALAWTAPAAVAAPRAKAGPMLDARGLLKRLREVLSQGGTGPDIGFAFIDAPGLGDAAPRVAEQVERRLQSLSLDGAGAARLSSDRFVVMQDAGSLADLVAEVRNAAQAEGLDLSPSATRATLPPDVDSAVAVRTLRLVLDACLKDGASVGALFDERLKRTVQDAERFRVIVRDRDFSLAYQPIIDLKTGAAHHFEALARFGGGAEAPVGPIQMAEELHLIEGFDLVVAEKALQQIRRPGFGLTKVAINASGVSLGSDSYIEGLLRLTTAQPELRKRLLVEITETAAIVDVEATAGRIAALRQAGIQVALDDFGAGAASLDYLRALRVDSVKLDGGFVRDLATDVRIQTLAGHLVALCRDLKMSTVAEMIETEEQAAAVRALGIDFGQGWLFGRPAAEPVMAAPAARARRLGEVTNWG